MTKVPTSDSVTLRLSVGHLRVLAGARTQDVWSCFNADSTLSAADVQNRLGLDSKTVYYQLRKLVRAGLLVEETKGRSVRFRKSVRRVSMPEGFQGAEFERLAARMVQSRLRRAGRQFQRAAARAPLEPSLVDWLYVQTTRMNLNSEQFAAFKARLTALLEEFSASEAGRPVQMLFVATPEGV